MSSALEVALLVLIIAVITVLGFLLKLIIDSIKLVQNLDETTTIVKNEVEPTLKELVKTLENLNSLSGNADKQLTQARRVLSSFLGFSSVALGGFKNVAGGFLKGFVEGIKVFTKK